MLPFSKHRSRDALRAGLVAIRSRQRVSERRSPEQGENGSAGCWPQKIHTRSCCKRKRKRDRPENILGASKAELISPNALAKHHWSQQSAAAHSFSHRQTLGRWAKISAKIATDKQIYSPTVYLDTTASFKARTIFPTYPGYFDSRTPDHFSEIFRIFRRQHFPKYLEYFGKMVPEIFGIFPENGGWLRFPDRFPEEIGPYKK